MYTSIHTYTIMYFYQSKEEILKAFCNWSHGIYNYLLPLSNPFSLYFHKVLQLVTILYLVGWPKSSFSKSLENSKFCPIKKKNYPGLPWWLSCKEVTCQFRKWGLNPWVGKIPQKRKWQPTLVFLPRKSHGQRKLVDYSQWGHKRVRYNLVTKQTTTNYIHMYTNIA